MIDHLSRLASDGAADNLEAMRPTAFPTLDELEALHRRSRSDREARRGTAVPKKMYLLQPRGFLGKLASQFKDFGITISGNLGHPSLDGFELEGVPFVSLKRADCSIPVLAINRSPSVGRLRRLGFKNIYFYEELRAIAPGFPPLGPVVTFESLETSLPGVQAGPCLLSGSPIHYDTCRHPAILRH